MAAAADDDDEPPIHVIYCIAQLLYVSYNSSNNGDCVGIV